ncbi:hypothetical protein HNQ88_001127 [Aureibacter tunicatorum]|uniref:Uncharacterized protein n=2 Tax=Aureibacter tunicatorum TaxID=866807 RepID=A0AAE4BR05_9BACT|nr:hypothetical protein [Aureibacter tunicatorum]BDD03184.1 hypothetical protein AUTU_06670 [Aureibacter tunicatorum]
MAQDEMETAKNDTLKYYDKNIRFKALPAALTVGTDGYRLAKTLLEPNYQGFSLQASTNILYNFYLTMEGGYENSTFEHSLATAKNRGQFLTYGVDFDLMPRNKSYSVIFIGARAGTATFSETLDYRILNEWESVSNSVTENGMQATWVEFVAGIRGNVYRGLFVGFTAKLKTGLNIKNEDNLALRPSFVPGYGKVNYNMGSNGGFEINLAYRFAFRRQYIKPMKIKKQKK